MTTNLGNLIDPYNRQARLYPALLTLLPAIVAYCAWVSPDESTRKFIIAFVAGAGVLYLLADFARACGKRVEPKLIKRWGGWPTTILLRHADATLTTEVKHRCHGILAKQLGVEVLPTAAEEDKEPERADGRYESATALLRAKCRGSSYRLVEKENATYGFRRNLLGLKPYGIILAIAPLFVPAAVSVWSAHYDIATAARAIAASYFGLSPAATGALALSTLATAIWIFVVTPEWVRGAGFQYARALIVNCDNLPGY